VTAKAPLKGTRVRREWRRPLTIEQRYERFEELAERVPFSECWVWTGHIDRRTGYGTLCRQLVHRFSYELFVGPIPAGLYIDHLCRNKWCVNPKHLEPVTCAENFRRYFATITHCPQGHEYDEENTLRLYAGNGMRGCRACSRARANAWYRRKKAGKA
jgi:hypothetical protein